MLQCLNMFFMPNVDELCKCYGLEPSSAKRFAKKSRIYRKIMLVIIWCFEILFYLFILRCLIVSYLNIPFDYFLYLACPLGLITALSFHLLGASFLRSYVLVLTMDFLVLRAEAVAGQIKRTFKGGGRYKPKFSKLVLLKRKKSAMKVLKTINDIVNQFEKSNQIFDNLISASMASILFGGLIFPAFVFVNFPFYHKLIVMFLYALAVINNCFIIAIFNDAFISKVCGR